jgi:aromatic ring-opening dioxygenase LigB subunit
MFINLIMAGFDNWIKGVRMYVCVYIYTHTHTHTHNKSGDYGYYYSGFDQCNRDLIKDVDRGLCNFIFHH